MARIAVLAAVVAALPALASMRLLSLPRLDHQAASTGLELPARNTLHPSMACQTVGEPLLYVLACALFCHGLFTAYA